MKIADISRATLESERHWTPLGLGNGSIVYAPKRLRWFLGDQSSANSLATRHRRALAKWGPSMHESSGSLSSSPRSIAHSNTAKAVRMASPIFLACLPEPATEYDRNGLTSLNPAGFTNPNPVGDSGIYLRWIDGLRAPSSPVPGVGLGGLVPRTESTALGGLVPRTGSTAAGGFVPRTKSTALGGLVPRTESTAAPKALPRVDSCPSSKALSWVGSCPALNILSWVGSLSPLPHFTIFAHGSHV